MRKEGEESDDEGGGVPLENVVPKSAISDSTKKDE
jgi:hypothetical protein